MPIITETLCECHEIPQDGIALGFNADQLTGTTHMAGTAWKCSEELFPLSLLSDIVAHWHFRNYKQILTTAVFELHILYK